ncbi:MAG TPA: hypothetical protein VJ729_04660 [Nitrososphaeraceae archaeon]|nr:hypothetical protein [Nitrososphaeraceae archaeon]
MTEEVTIPSILRSSDHDSKLCHDVLSYYTEVIKTNDARGNENFVFTELGKWLLDHHRPFVNEYAGSTTPKSYRLHSKRTYIQNRINDLMELRIMEEKGTTKSEKNSAVDTPVYGFTLFGVVVAWLIKAKNNNGEERVKAINKVFELLLHSIEGIDSYSLDLFSAFLKKCMNSGIPKLFGDDNKILAVFTLTLLDFMKSLYGIAHTPAITDPIRFFRVFFSVVSSIYKESQQMLIDTIKGMNNETQKIIMLQLKLDIESANQQHYRITTKAWEETRYKNRRNIEQATVLGRCEACFARHVYQISIIEFLKIPYLHLIQEDPEKYVIGPEKFQKLKCASCEKQNSVFILSRWYFFEKEYFQIFMTANDLNIK